MEYFDELPIDVWVLIFAELRSPRDITQARLVNSVWSELVRDSIVRINGVIPDFALLDYPRVVCFSRCIVHHLDHYRQLVERPLRMCMFDFSRIEPKLGQAVFLIGASRMIPGHTLKEGLFRWTSTRRELEIIFGLPRVTNDLIKNAPRPLRHLIRRLQPRSIILALSGVTQKILEYLDWLARRQFDSVILFVDMPMHYQVIRKIIRWFARSNVRSVIPVGYNAITDVNQFTDELAYALDHLKPYPAKEGEFMLPVRFKDVHRLLRVLPGISRCCLTSELTMDDLLEDSVKFDSILECMAKESKVREFQMITRREVWVAKIEEVNEEVMQWLHRKEVSSNQLEGESDHQMSDEIAPGEIRFSIPLNSQDWFDGQPYS